MLRGPGADQPMMSAGEPVARTGGGPHLLEIVEGADLGPEDMDDDVARIDEDPVAGRQALDTDLADAGFLSNLGR